MTEVNKSPTWKTKNLLLSLLCVLLHFKHTHIGCHQPRSGLEEEAPGCGWRREYSARFCGLQSLHTRDPVTYLKATNDANKNHLSPTLSFYNLKSPRISQWIHSRLHCQLVKFRFPKQLVEELPTDRGISLWYENVTNTTGSVVYCEVIHLIIHTFLLWALHTSYLQHILLRLYLLMLDDQLQSHKKNKFVSTLRAIVFNDIVLPVLLSDACDSMSAIQASIWLFISLRFIQKCVWIIWK